MEGQDCVLFSFTYFIYLVFRIKLNCSRDINTKSLKHFPLLKGLDTSENDLCSEKIKVYVESLEGASTNYETRFSDLENLRTTFVFLVNTFVVEVV